MTTHNKQTPLSSRHPAWLAQFKESGLFPAELLDFVALESDAKDIKYVGGLVVPGLLQTEQYMTALTQLLPGPISYAPQTPQGKLFTELRLARQWHVLERPNPVRLTIILDESALRRPSGSAQIMHEQLQHLLTVSRHGSIALHVLPWGVPISHLLWLGTMAAQVMHFAKGLEPVLSVEQYLGTDLTTRNRYEIAAFEKEFSLLKEQALSPVASRDLVEKIGQAYAENHRN